MSTEVIEKTVDLEDVRVGDTIKRVLHEDGFLQETTITVGSIDGGWLYVDTRPHGRSMWAGDEDVTLIRLSRPSYSPKAGEAFASNDGTYWVAYSDHRGELSAAPFRSGTLFTANGGPMFVGTLEDGYGPLVPLFKDGDGYSEWLWDPDTDTGWVEVALRGAARTHHQVFGKVFSDGFLLPDVPQDGDLIARLRPWRERGQR